MRTLHLLLLLFLLVTSSTFLSAQEGLSGKITYEQIIDYQLAEAIDHPLWADYIKDLPERGKTIQVLYFTGEQSFYAEDPDQKAIQSDQLKEALMKANYDKTPQPVVQQTYLHFGESQKTEQIAFMTRYFLVQSELEKPHWKLNGKQKKIEDYICMGAELEEKNKTLTAWFSPQIPVSVGPGTYFGLPGAILGLEQNGEVFLLATQIELKALEQELKPQLDKGQKVSSKKFEQIVQERTAQYEKDRAARDKAMEKKEAYKKN